MFALASVVVCVISAGDLLAYKFQWNIFGQHLKSLLLRSPCLTHSLSLTRLVFLCVCFPVCISRGTLALALGHLCTKFPALNFSRCSFYRLRHSPTLDSTLSLTRLKRSLFCGIIHRCLKCNAFLWLALLIVVWVVRRLMNLFDEKKSKYGCLSCGALGLYQRVSLCLKLHLGQLKHLSLCCKSRNPTTGRDRMMNMKNSTYSINVLGCDSVQKICFIFSYPICPVDGEKMLFLVKY